MVTGHMTLSIEGGEGKRIRDLGIDNKTKTTNLTHF
jgi:hypothetical protein